MAFTPTEEHDRALQKPESIDFDELDKSLAENIDSNLQDWFSDKPIKQQGQWIKIGNNGSLTVNAYDGHWTSFEDEAKGKGLLSLYSHRFGVELKEAAEELSNKSKLVTFRQPVLRKPIQKEPESPQWEHCILPPDSIPDSHWDFGKADHVAKYSDRDGNPVGIVMRWDANEERSKEIRPMSWVQMNGKESPEWKWCHFAEPRPLYRGERIAREPDKPILIVEGEKTAEAAELLLPDYVVISWPQGCSGVNKADWQRFEGRDVTIWPDADGPGIDAASKIAKFLTSADIVDTSKFPDKWDLGDALKEGKSSEWIVSRIEECKAIVPKIECGMANMPRSFDQAKQSRPDVIIEGLLYKASKMLIGGVAKAGKSHFVMDLVASLSKGETFLKWQPAKRYKVLYIDFELHEWELRERTGKAFDWAVPDNFGRLSLRKFSHIRSPKEISKVLNSINVSDYDVVVLDCLYKFNQAEDENDNSQMQAICAWFDEIIATHGITPIIIHHFGKGSQGGKSVVDRFRGASSLVGDMDAILSLTAHEEDGNVIVETEVRSFAPTEPFVVKWDYPNFTIDDNADASKHAKPGAKRKTDDKDILNALWVGEGNARHFSQLSLSMKKDTFDRRIKQINCAKWYKKKNENGKLENAYFKDVSDTD